MAIETTLDDKREIRRRWMEGQSAVYIASSVTVDAQTVRRICQDLPPQVPRVPLTNQKIMELMRTWIRIENDLTP